MRKFAKLLSLALAVLMVASVSAAFTVATDVALVRLPDNAIAIDNIGYRHAASTSIMGGDGLKVSDFTKYEDGFKDMNYAKVVLVDKDGVVTDVKTTLGEPKSDMTCPDGGYLISYNGNKAGHEVIDTIRVGDIITLYNVDRTLFPKYIGKDVCVDIPSAGFTVEKAPVENPSLAYGKPYTTDQVYVGQWDKPDEGGKTLTDGIKAEVSGPKTHTDPAWVGFQPAEGKFATVAVDLQGEFEINKISVQYYQGQGAADDGILPIKTLKAYVSSNGTDWTLAGDLIPEAVPEKRNDMAHLTLDKPVKAKFVKVEGFTEAGKWFLMSEVEVFGKEAPKNTALITVNAVNPDPTLEGSTTIFTKPGAPVSAGMYVDMGIFEKAENDTYKLTSFFSGAQDDGIKNVPEGGFIVTYNTGNNWPKLMADADKAIESGSKKPGDFWYYDDAHRNLPNFITEMNEVSGEALRKLPVGTIVKIQGIDLKAGTIEVNNKERYEDGFISNAVIYLANEPAPGKKPIPTTDYVEDGLVSEFDAELATPGDTIWVDQYGENDITVPADDNNKFENGYYLNTKTPVNFPQAIVDLINSDEFTLEVAFGDVTIDGTFFGTLINSDNDNFSLFARANKTLELKISSNQRPKKELASHDDLDNATLSVVFKKGETAKLYMNGTLFAEGKDPITANVAADNLFFGHNKVTHSHISEFKGFRFYNRALTADEVAANYGVDRGGIDANLTEPYWDNFVEVDADNGTLQNGVPEGFNPPVNPYDFRFAADKDYLYFAGIAHEAAQWAAETTDQTGASNFRIWFDTNNDGVRDFFVDLYNGPDGKPVVKRLAIGNAELVTLTASDIILASSTTEDSYILEAAIPLDKIGAGATIRYMVTYSSPNFFGQLDAAADGKGYNAFHYPQYDLKEGWKPEYAAKYAVLNLADVDTALEPAPYDAVKLNNLGYHHVVGLAQIIAGDGLTVEQIAGKDLNYNKIIVVDANGTVVRTYDLLGRPDGVKSDVKCPVGGYIICIHNDLAFAGVIQNQNTVADTIHPGDHVTLYNVDLNEVRAHNGVDNFVDLVGAGFTVEPFSVDGVDLPIAMVNGKLPAETNGIFTKYSAEDIANNTFSTTWTKFRRLKLVEGNVYEVMDDIWAFGGKVEPLAEGEIFLAIACSGSETSANLLGNYVAYGMDKGDFIKIVGDITTDGEVVDVVAEGYELQPEADLPDPVEFDVIEGNPVLQGGAWAGLDALLDGDLALDITGYEGNQGKLVAIQNPDRKTAAAKYELVFNFETEQLANRALIYILNYSNGCVGLPESVTVTINGETFDATVEPVDGKMNVIVANFGKEMTFTNAVITVVNPLSEECKGEFNCISEVVFDVEVLPSPVEWAVDITGDVKPGAIVNAVITLEDIADGTKLSGIAMYLKHSENLIPVNLDEDISKHPDLSFYLDFITAGTKKDFFNQSTSKYLGTKGSDGNYTAVDYAYYLCYATMLDEKALVKGDTFEITVPFKVADDIAEGDTVTVELSFNDEVLLEKYPSQDPSADNMVVEDGGTIGSLEILPGDASISVEYAEEPAPESSEPAPESSEPAPESSEPAPESSESAPESSEPTPDAGDAGIAAIIILAVAAIAAAAIIIKKRA